MRVISVTSDRADVGLLAPVWQSLVKLSGCDLHLFATGGHCDEDRVGALPGGVVVHRGGASLGGTGGAEAAKAMAAIGAAAAETFDRVAPDIVLVAGDRLDMLPTAMATVPLNLPLAHLHGGELTYGAVDDRVRHAVTKLAHMHLTANAEAAERISRMGEEGWRITVTGAPGLDALRAVPEMSAAAFAARVGLDSTDGLRLVTVHPETNAAAPERALDAVLDALATDPAPTLLTAPNTDPGGLRMRERVAAFAEAHPWAVYRTSLGTELYANALRLSAVMVGNSSSGIIEAGLFGLPVINVGDRQSGRRHGDNVRDVPAEAAAVRQALAALHGVRLPASGSLYGDGKAAGRIAGTLAEARSRQQLLDKRYEPEVGTFINPWQTENEESCVEKSLA